MQTRVQLAHAHRHRRVAVHAILPTDDRRNDRSWQWKPCYRQSSHVMDALQAPRVKLSFRMLHCTG